jgi:hypothetical protein
MARACATVTQHHNHQTDGQKVRQWHSIESPLQFEILQFILRVCDSLVRQRRLSVTILILIQVIQTKTIYET